METGKSDGRPNDQENAHQHLATKADIADLREQLRQLQGLCRDPEGNKSKTEIGRLIHILILIIKHFLSAL